MSRNSPSLLALLGLVAVAGYQNREAIGRMLGHATAAGAGAAPTPPAPAPGGAAPWGPAAGSPTSSSAAPAPGGVDGGLLGGTLGTGLRDLLNHFKGLGNPSMDDKVQSWVGPGQNQPVPAQDLRTALGPDVIATLAERTGMSEDELLERLSTALPETVDRMTPEGRAPQATDAPRPLPPSIDALLRGA